jgi:Na+/H+-dicarboxylate symporter
MRRAIVTHDTDATPARRRSSLPIQMLAGLALGLLVGIAWPSLGKSLQPIGTAFIQAIQMIVIPLIFAAVTLGVYRMGENARKLGRVAIIALSPLAIFAIMAWLFATQGLATIAALARLIGLMYLGLIVMVLACWLVLALLRENPFVITRRVLEPVLLAFTTRSSEVTLPVHMETLERMGVPNKVVALVLPLGYSFNLDGNTLYVTLAVTFLAEAYHVDLTWAAELTILVTAMIASKGIANVPSGGLVALATVLTAIGLPVEAIAIIAGVDAFMDMGRTAVNVFGNTVAVKLVQKLGGLGAAESDLSVEGATADPLLAR